MTRHAVSQSTHPTRSHLAVLLVLLFCLAAPLAARAQAQAPGEEAVLAGAGSVTWSTGVVQVQERPLQGPTFTRDTKPFAVSANDWTQSDYSTSLLPWTLAAPGQGLPDGAAVATGSDSGTRLSLPEGVQIQLDQDSAVILPTRDAPDRLRLEKGRAWIRTRRPLTLQTAQGEVRLTGTEVVLSAGPTATAVTLVEGQARLGGRELQAGQEATLGEGSGPVRVVEIDLDTRRSWVRERVAPDAFALRPFYADEARRGEARRQAMATLEAEPSDAGALVEMARVYLDEGRPEDAASALDRAGSDSRVMPVRGRAHLLRGDHDQARQVLETWLSLPGEEEAANRLQPNLDLGIALWAGSDLEGARRHLETALRLAPEDPYALATTGYLVDFQDGDSRRAAERLRRAIQAIPEQPLFHSQLGDAYASLGQTGAAVAEYRRTIDLDPEADSSTWLRLGSAYTRSGQTDQALEAFSNYRQRSLSPTAEVHASLSSGYAALLDDRLEEAWTESNQALAASQALDPSLQFLALDLQGLVLTRQRDYTKAIQQYRAALDLRPGDPFVTHDLGLAMLDTGEQTTALELLTQARQRMPSSAAVRANLGMASALLGMPRRAQAELEQAVALSPGQGHLWDTLSDVYEQQDMVDAAGRMRMQGRMLSPLLIAPRPLQFELGADVSESTGPSYQAAVSGRTGNVALSGRSNLDRALAGANQPTSQTQGLADLRQQAKVLGGSAELGWMMSPSDRLWVSYYGGPFEVRGVGQKTLSTPQDLNVGYYRELGPSTGLWLRYRTLALSQQFDAQDPSYARGLIADTHSDLSEQSLEVRLDQQLSHANTLSLGYATLSADVDTRTLNISPNRNTETDLNQNVTRFWLSDRWRMGRDWSLDLGATFDQAREHSLVHSYGRSGNLVATTPIQGTGSTVNPFMGLRYRPSLGAHLDLTVLRQSDIGQRVADSLHLSGTEATSSVALQSRSRLYSYNYLLPALVSSTTLFPLDQTDMVAMDVNSPTGIALPYWDYRLNYGTEVGANTYLSAQLFRSEVFPTDVDLTSPSAIRAPWNLSNRSRLQGGQVQLEWWNSRDAVASVDYKYRDYRFLDGPQARDFWLQVPAHDVQVRMVKQVASNLAFEVAPEWQSRVLLQQGMFVPDNLTTNLLLHWTPVPETRLSVGYENLFSINPTLAKGWLMVLRARF